jgi:hypothetical protein
MQNGYIDRVLVCVECGEEFAFTAAAQEYFAERGYTDDPKRCKSCHMQFKKSQRNRSNRANSSMYDADQRSN